MNNGKYYSCGKQVLLLIGGERIGVDVCQACDPKTAATIAAALNDFDFAYVDVPCEVCNLIGSHVPTCERGRSCETPTTVAAERTDT